MERFKGVRGRRSRPPVRRGGYRTRAGYVFELTGGRLCLDFANTVDDRLTPTPKDLLTGYKDLVDWALQAGAIDRRDAAALRGAARQRPRAADRAVANARRVREAVFDVFSAVAAGRRPPAPALTAVNRALRDALAGRCLGTRGGQLVWIWRKERSRDLARLLRPVLLSAADLLTSREIERVRKCPGSGCGWLFLDRSKSRTRRWCDMTVCGNRSKARRHYARTKRRRRAPDGSPHPAASS